MVRDSIRFAIDENAFNFPQITHRHRPCFDCTDSKGKDSQGLQKFIDKRALKNQDAHLGTTYLIQYKRKNIGYVTVATSNIHKDKIFKKARPNTRDGSWFPAMIILDFCIDKSLRSRGFGKYALIWCTGLARTISSQIGCRYIVLFTKDAVDFYQKHNFQLAESEDAKDFKLMYADIFPELKK